MCQNLRATVRVRVAESSDELPGTQFALRAENCTGRNRTVKMSEGALRICDHYFEYCAEDQKVVWSSS